MMTFTPATHENHNDDLAMRVFHPPDNASAVSVLCHFSAERAARTEKRLMHAILEDAVTSCRLYFGAKTRHHQNCFGMRGNGSCRVMTNGCFH
jgi:hypothetical protein